MQKPPLRLLPAAWNAVDVTDPKETAYRAAAERALQQFPVVPTALELVSVAENITFRAQSPEGQFALRLHRPHYNTLEELISERSWASALLEAGIAVQAPLQTSAGTHFCEMAIPELGETRYVGMTRWLPGTPLAEHLQAAVASQARESVFRRIGELAAQLHSQVSTWREPRGFTRPRLDLDGLLGEAPRWGRFWEHPALAAAEREQLSRARSLLQARLRDYGADPGNFGLIHADLHAGNVLVHDETLGLIDFDDAAYGWFVYDLATALVEYWDEADFPRLRAALLQGYRTHRALPARDEAMLDSFLLMRSLAIIGWLYQRPEHSAYLAEHAPRTLAACARMLDA